MSLDLQGWVAIFLIVVLATLVIGLALLLRSARRTERVALGEIEILRNSRKTVQSAYTQVVNDLQSKQQEVAWLQSQLDAIRPEQSQTQAVLQTSEKQISELSDAALNLQTQLHEQRVQFIDSQRTVADQQSTITSLAIQLDKAKQRAAQVDALQKMVDGHSAKLSDAEQTLSNQQAIVATLTEQLDQAKQEAALVPQLYAQLDEQRVKLFAADNMLMGQRSTIADLSNQLHALKEQAAQFHALEFQVEQDKNVIADLTTQILQLQAQIDEQPARLADAEKKLKEYEATIHDLTHQLDQTKQQIAQMSAPLMQFPQVYPEAGKVRRTFENRSASRRRSMPPRNIGGDELESINGIGPIYAARLRAAGMRTFKSIANATTEELDKVIKPHRWQRPDYADWINQAKNMNLNLSD